MTSTARHTAFLLLVGAAIAAAAPARAQSASPTAPMSAGSTGDIVLTGEWLQANALPMDRNAFHSVSFGASWRRNAWAFDGGFLRAARTLSTVQGAYAAAGPILRYRSIVFIPQVAAFGGEAMVSADTTGYDYTGAGGVIGHQPRYSYSEGGSAGIGARLTVEVPVYGPVAIRGAASTWYFSGAPLEGDQRRTLLGIGLSLRVWQ